MSITYGPTRPPTAPSGTIFVNRNTGEQWLRDGTTWVAITARADVLPWSVTEPGEQDQHIAKASLTNPFQAKWVTPSEGIVFMRDQDTPEDVWPVVHLLGNQWVDVTVISPGNTDPTAPLHKLLIPDVDYIDDNKCELHFAKPVVGTVLVRR